MELELTLSDYRNIVRKRLAVVITLFAVAFVACAVLTNLQKPKYRAQTILKYEPPISLRGSPLEIAAQGMALQTQISLINSPDMAARVAQKAGDRRYEYKGDKLGLTSLLGISVSAPDPAEAAEIANLVAETFIEWDVELRSQELRRKFREITARRTSVEQELRGLEQKRSKFVEQNEAAMLGSALANTLLELESKHKEMLKRFTPAHPEVRKSEERIEVVRRRLAEIPRQQEELQRMSRDLRVAEETFVALSRQVEELKLAVDSTLSHFTMVSRATPPKSPYSPNKKLNYIAGLLLGLLLGIFGAVVLENLDISITTIEEIEKVIEAPVLGIIPHFGSVSRWQDLWTTLLRRERHSEEAFRSFLVFRHPPKSPHIEVYHALRVNIQSQLSKPENIVLTFTSTGVAEGKTLTAVNFAMAAAHSGLKTLLIGADIRRPSIHRIFGLPREPGLIEAMTGNVPWQDTIRSTLDILMGEQDLDRLTYFPGIDNFKVMTGWTATTAEVVNLFSSHRLPKLIADLRAHFDIVVFDCPPVLLFVDAMLIGQHTDGVVLVYKSGKMARRALKRARDQVVVSKGRILGVVLNDARATDMEPGYGYYSDYGHYLKPQGEPS